MKIKKRLKDKAGMLVLTAVLVVAALIASVVSGCTEQVKAAENEVAAETSADTDKRSHKETNDYQSRSCGKAWNGKEDR